MFLELADDKTFEQKGAKNIIIKTNGYEKSHVTLILAISAGGNKLPPVIIFKGTPDKNNEKRYNKLEVVKDKRILVFFQNNAWVNDAIFKKWLDCIYLEYESKLNKKCYLILDKAPSHITKNIMSYFKNKEVEYTFVPAKLTRFLQPLDIGINFPFKTQLKNKYLINEANKITNTEPTPTTYHIGENLCFLALIFDFM